MSLLCLIPARGGSKGLENKNLRTVGGISLVGRAVLTAREFLDLSGVANATIIVDTDSEAIAAEGRAWGAEVPFLRPARLSGDATPTIDSTLAVLDRLEEQGATLETVVLLQPTSPLRTAEDVLVCWQAYHPDRYPSVLSVVETGHPVELALRLEAGGEVHWVAGGESGVRRRQDFAPAYWASGAVYVSSASLLRKERTFLVPGITRGVPLPHDRSLDIDTAVDLLVAEGLMRQASPAPLDLSGCTIGSGHPCLVIAEAGVNHNGDPKLAYRLVDVAADAGAGAVKFQTFDPELLVAAGTPRAEYQIAGTGGGESQLEMLRRLVLPREELGALAEYARARGLLFLSTPFDEGSADFLDTLGVAAFKVPSGEVTNHPFLAHLARKGKPLLMSTGMSTLAEVAEAVREIRTHGRPPLALLHCVSSYPAPSSECNLLAIETMRQAFQVPVGWSDHTIGLTLSLAAVARGANVLEKHFTLDRGLPGPDHAASLEPRELEELVAAVRRIEEAGGDGIKRPMASEAENVRLVRRSLHAARPLRAGEVLREADLISLRPGTGIPPSARGRILGRTLRVAVARGEMLREDHVA